MGNPTIASQRDAKRCSRCRRVQPVDSFTKSSKSKDGRGYYCARCRKDYRAENAEKARERGREWAKANPTYRTYRKEMSAAWREANKQKVSDYKRQYREKNEAAIRAYGRAYRDQNAERLLSEARVRAKRWRAENPEKARAKDDRRRALKLGAFVEHVDVLDVYERASGKCFVCGELIDPALRFPDPRSLTLEHVVPLALGGLHERGNCAVSHYRCNASKGAKLPTDFSGSR